MPQSLVARIRESIAERQYCHLFNNHIRQAWPCPASPERKKQIAAIEAFAHANGWSVSIQDLGLRATFRAAGPVQAGAGGQANPVERLPPLRHSSRPSSSPRLLSQDSWASRP